VEDFAGFKRNLGDSTGYIFPHRIDWIAVVVPHSGQSATLVEHFSNQNQALKWLDSYSVCFCEPFNNGTETSYCAYHYDLIMRDCEAKDGGDSLIVDQKGDN